MSLSHYLKPFSGAHQAIVGPSLGYILSICMFHEVTLNFHLKVGNAVVSMGGNLLIHFVLLLQAIAMLCFVYVVALGILCKLNLGLSTPCIPTYH